MDNVHPSLLSIPMELQLNIINNLPFSWRENLAMTNRHLYTTVNKPMLEELLAFEKDLITWDDTLLHRRALS
jgi:hypothetical protein